MFQFVTPGAGLVLTPRASYEQGDAKNQISKLYAFQFQRRRILKMGFFVPMFQLVTPRGGGGQSWPQEHHMNKLDRGPLEDATYQISNSSPYGLGQEDF